MRAAADTRKDLRLYLCALYGSQPEGFVEIAHRREKDGRQGPMHRGRTGLFRPLADLALVAREIERLAHREHVWVGVVPRRPHPETGELGGTRAHVGAARVLWADCDSADEVFPLERLQAFEPRPHMLVGSGGGYHAYWLLRDSIDDPEHLRESNERLASALGGDLQSADAARILRPPGTLNFKAKYGRPRPVELLLAERRPSYGLDEVVGLLPRARSPRRQALIAHVPGHSSDPLQRIAPANYFAELTGLEPGRDGKVCCPLPTHADPGPSCHVYKSPAKGWYCYGCGRGGDIYELAGELWHLRREGREFLELRAMLALRFGLQEFGSRAPRATEGTR